MGMRGEELKAIRKACGMTQGDLANALGLSSTFIGLMERGEKAIEPRTEMSARYVSVVKRSEAVAALAQKLRRASHHETQLEADDLEQAADWLDLMSSLPREDVSPKACPDRTPTRASARS